MKKKLLSLFFVLCLALTLLPITVLAVGDDYNVWVGGVELNSTNSYLVNGAAAGSGTPGSGGCTAYFNASSGTLTLNGANLVGVAEPSHRNAAIYADGDLSIELVGNNTAVGADNDTGCSYGVYVSLGALTISGSGSLNTTGGTAGNGNSAGIYAYRTLIINGGTVMATGGTGTGISSGISSSDYYSIVISGAASVTAVGGTGNQSHGINSGNGTNNVTVSGTASVTAIGGKATGGSDHGYGICGYTTYTGGLLVAKGQVRATRYEVKDSSNSPVTPLSGVYTNNFAVWGPADTYTVLNNTLDLISDTSADTGWSDSANSRGWRWQYSASEPSILTLKNVIINAPGNMSADCVGIMLPNLDSGANIELEGVNIVSAGLASTNSYAVCSSGAMTIEGSGALIAVSDIGYYSYGISSVTALNITGGTITAIGGAGTTDSIGVSAGTTFSLSSGHLTAIGGASAKSRGVNSYNAPNITGGGVAIAGSGSSTTQAFSRTPQGDTDHSPVLTAGAWDGKLAAWKVITNYNVWVGGERVTSANKDGVTGAGITGTVVYTPASGSTPQTLRLTNASITGALSSGDDKFGICAEENLRIELAGQYASTIGGEALNADNDSYGVHVDGGNLSIYGDGSLIVNSGEAPNGNSVGVYVEEDDTGGDVGLRISGNARLTATGGISVNSVGILCMKKDSSDQICITNISISNSVAVSASGSHAEDVSCGIYSTGGVQISDAANVTVSSGEANTLSIGIMALNSIAISGGTVKATSGEAITRAAMSLAPDLTSYTSYQWRTESGGTFSTTTYVYDHTHTYVEIKPYNAPLPYTPPAPVTEIKNGGSTTGSNLGQLVADGKTLTVDGDNGAKLVFEPDALKGIAGQTSGDIKVEMKDVSPVHQENLPGKQVFSLTVSSASGAITNFGGSVTVTLPYTLRDGETANEVTVWYLSGDGTMTELPCTYDPATGLATFKVTHFSLYVVGTESWVNPFTDVSENDWFYDAVRYVSRSGLMQGTGAAFSPGAATIRGMLVTILWRLENEPDTAQKTTFTDVTDGAWYEKAVAWASKNGIVTGYDGKFDPEGTLTREQMATILYRYAGYKGYDVTGEADLSRFSDSNSISSYAQTAMRWANAGELINGTDGNLINPLGDAARCQVAAILQRFIENAVK